MSYLPNIDFFFKFACSSSRLSEDSGPVAVAVSIDD